MKIGVLGTGAVGSALGKGFITLGHEVMMGARSAGNDKAVAWAGEMGGRASQGSFADAAKFGEVIVLATLGAANEAVLAEAGPDNLAGKILIDATNPLDPNKRFTLFVSGNDSGGEQVQRQVPKAKVVKAWNTVGNSLMFQPKLVGGPPDMMIAGNDAEAKQQVAGILKDFGWETVDLGGIDASRYLEAICIAWCLASVATGDWNRAFKLLRRA